MKPTVAQALSARPVAAGDELLAINNELRPVLSQARDAANFESVSKSVVTSADSAGIPKRIWESGVVPTTGNWLLELRIVAANPSGSWKLSRVRYDTWRFDAGVGTRVDTADGYLYVAGFGALTSAFDSAASTVYAQMTDDGTGTVTWCTVGRVLEVVL